MKQLNKELCLKCFCGNNREDENDVIYYFTEEEFHHHWEKGRCLCWAHYGNSVFWSIYTTPPDNCLYLLEQLVMNHG